MSHMDYDYLYGRSPRAGQAGEGGTFPGSRGTAQAGGAPAAAPHTHGKSPQGAQRWSTPLDHKAQYVMECYGHKHPAAPTAREADRRIAAPTVPSRRQGAVQFGGLGALCAIGSSAAILSGPFPLNIAAGVGIAIPFVVEAARKARRRRAGSPSRS